MIYIVVIFLATLLIYSIRKRFWAPVVYMTAVYLLSLIFSVILLKTTNNYHVDILSCLLFVVEIMLFFSPFFIKKPVIEPCYNPDFIKHFKIIGLSIGGIIILCMLILIPSIEQVFYIGLADARSASIGGEQIYTFEARGIQAYSYRILASLYPLSYSLLLMFFYSLSFYNKNTVLNWVLFLSSFAGIIIGVFNGGRTNMTYWLLAFLLLFIIFYPYLTPKKKARLFSLSGVFFVFFVFYFILVSDARFGNERNDTLIRYTGSSFLNFCDFIQHYHADHFSLRRIFPFLSELIGGPMNISEYREIIYSKSQMDIGLFFTLLGDLYVDIGIIGMFIYTLLFMFFAKKNTYRKQYTLSSLLVFWVIFLIPLQGVFYYSYWRSVVTLCSVGVIIYSVFLKNRYHA